MTYGSGWGKKAYEKVYDEKKGMMPPETCDLCGGEIQDYYYVGFDQHRIYAEVCDKQQCMKWLKWSIKKKREQ